MQIKLHAYLIIILHITRFDIDQDLFHPAPPVDSHDASVLFSSVTTLAYSDCPTAY